MKLTSVLAAILFWSGSVLGQTSDVEILQRTVEDQGREIEQLKAQLNRIEEVLARQGDAAAFQPAAYRPVRIQTPAAVAATPQVPSAVQVAGVRFSGDFRLRLDAAIRGASPAASGTQNIRGRYRLRLNADREVAPDLNLHLQLSTGAANNGITFDQDFAGGAVRHPFLISEAYADFHPRSNLSIRAGRQEEIYADNTRFLWDDDLRLNGFSERARFGKLELRGGQYFIVNPNVFSVPAGSALTLAGEEPGRIARASQLFHQGMTIDAPINTQWKHQMTTDIQIYRNPNLIALTSNGTGVASTVSPAVGYALAGASPGTGNATASPASAVLFARHYQIARVAYRLDASELGGNPRLPLSWVVQVSRNVGTSQLRDAILSSVSVGRTSRSGDIRGLYAFAIKDANSMISQFTDDDLGTGAGVNLATHHLRMDYTLRPGIQLQNLLFLQTERRNSNPAAGFYVPLGRSTPRTWRYQGQLGFSF